MCVAKGAFENERFGDFNYRLDEVSTKQRRLFADAAFFLGRRSARHCHNTVIGSLPAACATSHGT
jgi:hypothetical protein